MTLESLGVLLFVLQVTLYGGIALMGLAWLIIYAKACSLPEPERRAAINAMWVVKEPELRALSPLGWRIGKVGYQMYRIGAVLCGAWWLLYWLCYRRDWLGRMPRIQPGIRIPI